MTEVCSIMGVSSTTLKKKYKNVIDRAKASFRINIRQAQYEKAVKDKNSQMLIWLGKQYLGQSDKVENKHKLEKPQVISFSEEPIEPFEIEQIETFEIEEVETIEIDDEGLYYNIEASGA